MKRRFALTAVATVTGKGQITVPVAIRKALGVGAGDRVEFVEVAPGRFEVIAATRSVADLKGMFGKRTTSVSVDEMDAAIAGRGASARGSLAETRHERTGSGTLRWTAKAIGAKFDLANKNALLDAKDQRRR